MKFNDMNLDKDADHRTDNLKTKHEIFLIQLRKERHQDLFLKQRSKKIRKIINRIK